MSLQTNNHIKKYVHILIFGFISFMCMISEVVGQKPTKPTSGEIYQQMEKLGFLGSVLYVAAHPDDENTRFISYMANEKKAHTTYLSLTRGDGGQNLIGPEISELLGVVRTQELLMARSIDHGNQMFSRANDFGYSKNAEETIKIWDTEKVKADVIWAIRNTRPDVIVNRFDHRTSGKTHGHHTASALLSVELFDKAADSKIYPDQLKFTTIWQPRRLFFNTSWWFYGSEDKFNKADKSALMSVDVGVFFPLLGKSNTEIAAESRSMHKCQGFGSTGTRGLQLEYLELLKGDMPPSKEDIFEGINTTWSRIDGGESIKKMVDELLKKYDFKHPANSVPLLVEIYKNIQLIKDPFWKEMKSKEAKDLIAACLGLFLEARTNVHKVTNGEIINTEIEAINRSNAKVEFQSIKGIGVALDTVLVHPLLINELFKWSKDVVIPNETPLTAPYWLLKKGSLGLYNVENQKLIGKPQSERAFQVIFEIKLNDTNLQYTRDIVYKYNSPENGETYRPLEVVPPLSVKIKEPVHIFASDLPKDLKVTVFAWAKDQSGTLFLPLPEGWVVEPKSIDFQISQKGESKDYTFKIIPPEKAAEITVIPQIISKGLILDGDIIDINYDHIPFQTVYMKAETKLVRLEIQNTATRVAYIMGAGDEIPANLRQIGCQVDILSPDDLTEEKLSSYQALVVGVRAYNTEEKLKFKQPLIFDYADKGGTVVVQYNTANGLVTKDLAPYPITLSRNRVTVEEAEMKILTPEHIILNHPNKITSKDFDNWVQERGLYFPGEWDQAFVPIFSCNDPGEEPQNGSLLVSKYGEGHFIYTGISFFRQLPAGVSGAFRLFANIISIGADVQP